MANSVDPDQTGLQEQSDLGLHGLHIPLYQTLLVYKILFRTFTVYQKLLK